ncbi:alpha-ketoglutarate-dependent dioxygenase FTO-like [Oncorhynchus nerka]|uniref:alpha-ketoglutarate-dependent dioxygenase FTO-like n=1 Tax=Oncorhynchus nerka TaxID=8023 RepID=UPI0031B7FC56
MFLTGVGCVVTVVCPPLSPDDLNRTHQHCVLAGDSARFSSTHRVAECSTGTLEYIQSRCREALSNLSTDPETGTHCLLSLLPATLQGYEEIHNEVEFEWLRQYWFQGQRYTRFCSWWARPMEQLENDWREMELMTQLLLAAVEEEGQPEEGRREMAETLLTALTDRQQHRQTWRDR